MKGSDYSHMPPVGALMTPFPHTISSDTPVPELLARMEAEDFRHLPVMEDGALVGIVSIRDVHRLMDPNRPNTDRREVEAHQVMTPEPYVVESGESLELVLREMADRKIGTALVAKRGKLAGILTLTDACHAFADVLEDRYGSESSA